MHIGKSYYSWISFQEYKAALDNIGHKRKCWVSQLGWETLFSGNNVISLSPVTTSHFSLGEQSFPHWIQSGGPASQDAPSPLRGGHWPRPGQSAISSQKPCFGTSLVVQRLRLRLPIQGMQVQSLVWELKSHMPRGQKNQNIKQKQYCNKFNKHFKKWSTSKKILKKKKKAMFWSKVLSSETTTSKALEAGLSWQPESVLITYKEFWPQNKTKQSKQTSRKPVKNYPSLTKCIPKVLII